MLMPNSASDNLWRHYWHAIMRQHGWKSLLPILPLAEPPPAANGHLLRGRPTPRPKRARVARPPKNPTPRDRGQVISRRIERDVERVTRLPVSDWAKSIVGDERHQGMCLQDVLDGVEDYFTVFEQMRRTEPDAYAYFSRVGAPVFQRNSAIWKSQVDALTVASPERLPSYFGVFLASDRETERHEVLTDAPSLFDFHLFEKPKNHATVAPLGTTIFSHSTISLKRDVFTREERAKFPWAGRNFGLWWYVGVLPDGQVRALPHHMSHFQKLPNGGGVHHSAFHIPPGLHEIGGKHGPHDFVRVWFNTAVALTAAAIAGVTVTIRQGKRAARLGVPVRSLKEFFADRDPAVEGARRKPIMHLRLGHDRYMADGRIIAVGEHLSGERHFRWRDYDVTVGVPGVHFPSPEGFDLELFILNDPDAPLPADVDIAALAPIGHAAPRIAQRIRNIEPNPIRQGEPTNRYKRSALPLPRF